MTPSQLFADINTDCLTTVERAACAFHSEVRGCMVRQSFYIYPDNSIVSLLAFDGSYKVITLDAENSSIFRHLNKGYFQ